MAINSDMGDIYKKLDYFKDMFNPSKETHQTIQDIVDNKYSKEEALKKLIEINNRFSFDGRIKEYYDIILNDLMELTNLELGKLAKEEEINKKATEINENLHSRGVDIEQKVLKSDVMETYKDNRNYSDKLEKEKETLDSVKDALERSKNVGSEFGDEFNNESIVYDDLKEKNEEAKKNIKNKENPTKEYTLGLINYLKEKCKDNNNTNIKIVKPSSNTNVRQVEIFYSGNNVSEKDARYVLTFTDIDEFEKDIMPSIVTDYAILETTDYTHTEDGNYTNVAESGNTLELENMDDEVVNETSSYIDNMQNVDYVDYEKQRQNNRFVRVRQNDYGKVNLVITLISIVVVLCIISLILLFYTRR